MALRAFRTAGLALTASLLLALPVAGASPAPGGSIHPTASSEPQVFAIGDSVMLGAESCMEQRGYRVDALGSRQVSAVVKDLTDRGGLPPRVIVHTGTNGGADSADLDAVMRAIGPLHQVIWVTIQLPDNTSRYTFEDSTNRAIRSIPERYRNARVADWNVVSDRHPGWTGGDGIHLTPDGCRGYSRMLARELRKPAWILRPYTPPV